jgi:uncharacterized repeat protein (TIGR03803 family)
MSPQRLSRAVAVLTILAATPFMLATRASAQQEKVLHSFNSTSKIGTNPDSPLIFDSAGNLYGTTGLGGAYNGGSLFELTPVAGGRWTIKVLHEFGNGTDGKTPYGNLIFDAAGNLYGVTAFGGPSSGGTAFELSPQAGGTWRETILHSFNSSTTDGNSPTGGLVFDVSGNLYGTTNGGGADNTGTVFALSPAGGGTWTETILHSFGNNSTPDGQQPYLVQLVIDAAGNLYGTTEYGGAYKNGTVMAPLISAARTMPAHYSNCRPYLEEAGRRRRFTISRTTWSTGETLLPVSLSTRRAISTALHSLAAPMAMERRSS